jgi:hypothetical protein
MTENVLAKFDYFAFDVQTEIELLEIASQATLESNLSDLMAQIRAY